MLTTVEREYVKRGHGKTSTICQTADVTVELDKVQAVLASLDFTGVFLGQVAHFKHFLLAEVGVLVETELGVHTQHSAVLAFSKRIDLNLRSVTLAEQLVELDERVGSLLLLLGTREAKLVSHLLGSLKVETLGEVNRRRHDRIRVLLRNVLNRHTTLVGGNEHRQLAHTVVQQGHIVLCLGVRASAIMTALQR